MSFVIRDATPADAEVLAAGNAAMAIETEGKALDPDILGPGVARVLGDATKGRYWVAEADDRVVGQLMVTYEWSDWRNGMIWWIQSVYVDAHWRRQGVFSALYRHVESMVAADPEAIGLRLYAEQDNERAQQTYAALGMTSPGYLVMEAFPGNTPDDKEN